MITRTLIALLPCPLHRRPRHNGFPGSEIAGQRVEVETNGILNTVYFERAGSRRSSSPSGAKVVRASWTARGGKLCLSTDRTLIATLSGAVHRAPASHARQRLRRGVALGCVDDYIAPFERG